MEKRTDGGVNMFKTEELQKIDKKYFVIIQVGEADVTLISKNTGHIWRIHNSGYPMKSTCVIFHAHSLIQPYHYHGMTNTMPQAVKSIQNHDKWQLKGRPRAGSKGAMA